MPLNFPCRIFQHYRREDTGQDELCQCQGDHSWKRIRGTWDWNEDEKGNYIADFHAMQTSDGKYSFFVVSEVRCAPLTAHA